MDFRAALTQQADFFQNELKLYMQKSKNISPENNRGDGIQFVRRR